MNETDITLLKVRGSEANISSVNQSLVGVDIGNCPKLYQVQLISNTLAK